MKTLVNFLAFQLGWFACVLGAAHGAPWLGSTVALGVIALHLSQCANPKRELMLVVLCGILGLVLDSILVSLGLIRYASGTVINGLVPHWILAMWMIFATTLNITFRWLKGRTLLAAALGAAAGPLAYYGGVRLGAAELIGGPSAALLGVSAVWAISMPVLIRLSDRYDGVALQPGAGLAATPEATPR